MRTSRTCTEFAAINLSRAHSVRLVELEHARIAKRIQQARKQAGLTQQQTANLLGVIQRTYQNYESQSTPRVPWDRLNDIARITSVKVEWLLHGDTPDLLSDLDYKGTDIEDRFNRIEVALRGQLQLLLAMAQRLGVEGAEPLPAATEQALDEVALWLEQAASEREAARRAARR